MLQRNNIVKILSFFDGTNLRNDSKIRISYAQVSSTQNFGDFELFSMSSDSTQVRKLLLKAGKRFGIKMIEGGYKEKARIIRRKKSDYARVLKGDKILGHLERKQVDLVQKNGKLN